MSRDRLIIPGLRGWHLITLGMSFYLLQAIATADGAFKLNHDLAFSLKERIPAGLQVLSKRLDKSADQLDRWSIEQFGKEPWIVESSITARYASDCVTTPGRGYLSKAKIHRFRTAKQKDLKILGTPFCVAVSGRWRYLIDDPSKVFEVNPNNLNQYGSVSKP